jgi:hypothetical protein
MIAENEERGLFSHGRRLDGLDQISYPIVGVAGNPVGLVGSRPVRVLDVVRLHQVQQDQIGRVSLEELANHTRVEPVARYAAAGHRAPGILLVDRPPRLTQLLQPRPRSVVRPGVGLEHVGHGPVEAFGLAAGRPAHRRRLQSRLVGGVVDRGDLDRLVLVEHPIEDQGHGLCRGAIEIVVAYHTVPGRRGAGGQRRMSRPGDGWKRGDHPLFRTGALGRQFPHHGHVGPRIIKIEVGQAVNRHHDYATVLVRFRRSRTIAQHKHGGHR